MELVGVVSDFQGFCPSHQGCWGHWHRAVLHYPFNVRCSVQWCSAADSLVTLAISALSIGLPMDLLLLLSSKNWFLVLLISLLSFYLLCHWCLLWSSALLESDLFFYFEFLVVKGEFIDLRPSFLSNASISYYKLPCKDYVEVSCKFWYGLLSFSVT